MIKEGCWVLRYNETHATEVIQWTDKGSRSIRPYGLNGVKSGDNENSVLR